MPSQNAKVAHLTSQLIASSTAAPRLDEDEDELLAELEAEIENDDGPSREQGLKELQREYIDLCTRLAVLQITDNATTEWNA